MLDMMLPAPEKEMLQRRERELLAQLHELLYSPSSSSSSLSSSPPPSSGAGEPSCWTSSSLSGGGSGGGGKKRADHREEEIVQMQEKRGGSKAKRRKKKKEAAGGAATRTLVTTVPDFDGFRWRKYGQKHIEAAKYPRSYYRCTNSTDQGCPAKRTVQRNEDDGTKAAPKYTLVYISEHTCTTTDSALVPPVILETAAACGVVVPATSSSRSDVTSSPVSSSDATTWSEHHGCSSMFAIDDDKLDSRWGPSNTSTVALPSAAALLAQEMVDFAGPIRSPVHVSTGGDWINDFFVGEPPCVLNSCHLFGF